MTRANAEPFKSAEPKYHPEGSVTIKTKTLRETPIEIKKTLREENSWLLEAILKVAPTIGRKLILAGIPDKIKELPEDKQCDVLALLLLAELIETTKLLKEKR